MIHVRDELVAGVHSVLLLVLREVLQVGVQLLQRRLLHLLGAQFEVLLLGNSVVLDASLHAVGTLENRALSLIQNQIRVLGEAIGQAAAGTVLVPHQTLQQDALAQIAGAVEKLDESRLIRELRHEVLADRLNLEVAHAVVAQLGLSVVEKRKQTERVLSEDEEACVVRLEGRARVRHGFMESIQLAVRHVADDHGSLLQVLSEQISVIHNEIMKYAQRTTWSVKLPFL